MNNFLKIYVNNEIIGEIMHDPEGIYMGPHYYDPYNNELCAIVDQFLLSNQIFPEISNVSEDIKIETE